jgi:ABC-type multidrug transport system permease subunit
MTQSLLTLSLLSQVIFSLFCGVTVPVNVMPSFFSSWLYHLDPFTYIIEGLVTNELHGLEIVVRLNSHLILPLLHC